MSFCTSPVGWTLAPIPIVRVGPSMEPSLARQTRFSAWQPRNARRGSSATRTGGSATAPKVRRAPV